MRFDKCQNDINTPLFQSMSLFQHLVGLSHTGGLANKYFQPPALGALDQLEKVFRAYEWRIHQEISSVIRSSSKMINSSQTDRFMDIFHQRRTANRHQNDSTT